MTDYVGERIRPEALIAVPETVSVTSYHGVLGDLALRLSPYKGFPTYEYDVGTVHRDVYMNDKDIGTLNVQYDYQKRKVGISSVRLDAYIGHGVGIALYRTILDLPLPSGENPRKCDFLFESKGQSLDARKVWHRLVETEEAVQIDKTHFRLY